MITLERAAELLRQQQGVETVEVCQREYLRACFPNRINPDNPHTLIVHPIREELALKVLVPEITKLRSRGSDLFRVLQNLNYALRIGKVGTDARNGDVVFEINHPCCDGNVQDPSPEVFARLVEAARRVTHDVVLLATHVGMVEAGVPEDIASKVVKQLQPQDECDADDAASL